ncbi:type II toxin-antitoxin system HicB family antitoxin [Streptomyces sp. NPDC057445]|uniref:type II toxin-antitoxin system HicB family antitoxin n=1 Tax=Streptomyces sp. NPDC057445 TaxID=3346136 RepID=UPI00369DD9D3
MTMGYQPSSETDLTYRVRIQDEGEDGLWAEVPELPGCHAWGQDMGELEEALLEAIPQYISTLADALLDHGG